METRALSRTAKSQILPRICSGMQTVAERGLDAMRTKRLSRRSMTRMRRACDIRAKAARDPA
jgi:hypothetical protein